MTPKHHRSRGFIHLASVSLLALMSGCQESASTAEARRRVQPTYSPDTGRLTQLAYDSNGNGRHDMWAYMDGASLLRLEADENEDGRVDRWEYYPPGTSASAKRPPERIERSTRFDGRISRREFFERGVLSRIEEDTDGNDAADKWETYANGVLTILALDTTGRGKPDRRLLYNADGSLDRIEVDPSGTGTFQVLKQ